MNANTIGMLIIMIIYLGAMVLIGILFSRKNNDTSDFYLGGRKLGPIVTAMSAEASDMSSWLLMGSAGCRISVRLCRSRMDCHRTCYRNLSELAHRRKTSAPLFPQSK